MSQMSTGNFGQLTRPGVARFYGNTWEMHPKLYPMFMEVLKSDKNFERHVGLAGIGPAVATPEATAANYDVTKQGFSKDYVHIDVTNGFKITKNLIDDDLYGAVGVAKNSSVEVARSMVRFLETAAANILNRSTNSSYTGSDGVSLLSTSHVRMRDGATYANRRSGGIPFSELALEQLLIDIRNAKDDAGNFINLKAIQLIIPPALMFEAERILKSAARSGTADNDLNALKAKGLLQSIMDNPYLADSATQYFVQTDCNRGLTMYMRKEPTMDENLEFDNRVVKYNSHMRVSMGWDHPLCIFGNPGV